MLRRPSGLPSIARDIAIGLVTLVAIGATLQDVLVRRARDAQTENMARTSITLAARLRSEIEKFELVAIALSSDREAKDLLVARSTLPHAPLNQRLSSLRNDLGASVIYLLDRDGTTIAASNWEQPDSFVGQNYRFRSYFRDALRNGKQYQYALGTRSRVPGLYLARRVGDGVSTLGVIVVKVRFDALEQDWRAYPGRVFATNSDGVVLITDDPAQRFRTIAPLSEARREVLRHQLDFGDAPLTPDPQLSSVARAAHHEIESGADAGNGLRLHVTEPFDSARRNAQLSAWMISLMLVMTAAAFILFERWRRQAIRLTAQREAAQRIDLLKEELAQANRLATLGQIVAGVAHEIGQPIAAIALQADTGRQLAQNNDISGVVHALERIHALTGRVRAITGELIRFSRRGRGGGGPALVDEAIDGALLLLSDRIAVSGTLIARSAPNAGLAVAADIARCEQILVNLLQNALDALGGRPGSIIEIAVAVEGSHIAIDVGDNGPGIDPTNGLILFSPFQTSKATGLGLGLVISQDLARDLGGDLVLAEAAQGARFRLTLPVAA